MPRARVHPFAAHACCAQHLVPRACVCVASHVQEYQALKDGLYDNTRKCGGAIAAYLLLTADGGVSRCREALGGRGTPRGGAEEEGHGDLAYMRLRGAEGEGRGGEAEGEGAKQASPAEGQAGGRPRVGPGGLGG